MRPRFALAALSAMLLLSLAAGCSSTAKAAAPTASAQSQPVVTTVGQTGVEKAIRDGVMIVDVRTPAEYELGHIRNAINVPVDQVATATAAWDKKAPYVVYCAAGKRSAKAVEIMKDLGFSHIEHFASGFDSWAGLMAPSLPTTVTIATSGRPVVLHYFADG